MAIGATTTVPLVYDFYGFPERYYQLEYRSSRRARAGRRRQGADARQRAGHGPPDPRPRPRRVGAAHGDVPRGGHPGPPDVDARPRPRAPVRGRPAARAAARRGRARRGLRVHDPRAAVHRPVLRRPAGRARVVRGLRPLGRRGARDGRHRHAVRVPREGAGHAVRAPDGGALRAAVRDARCGRQARRRARRRRSRATSWASRSARSRPRRPQPPDRAAALDGAQTASFRRSKPRTPRSVRAHTPARHAPARGCRVAESRPWRRVDDEQQTKFGRARPRLASTAGPRRHERARPISTTRASSSGACSARCGARSCSCSSPRAAAWSGRWRSAAT